MQVSRPNNVKIYNLSAGKSIPEWLTDRKRRALMKKDLDIRRRIELIQDFDMPNMSNTIKISKDGKYILATGTYKPRVKCFDVDNLSLKFERCFDAEAVTFEILSDDYSKLVFLQDRYVELHMAPGRHYRFRVPRPGRDIAFNYRNSDLYVVGSSSDVYRFNLEKGMFQTPYQSTAPAINKCEIHEGSNLLFCGTQDGKVQAWNPHNNLLVATLDVAKNFAEQQLSFETFPSVTALKLNGSWSTEMAVGTATGHVLLYDLRKQKPLYTKDHMYRLPIKDIEFHKTEKLVYSMDETIVKIWNKDDGKLYTAIEGQAKFNNLCVVPDTGMLFIANDNKKMQTYFIPSLGTAPRWAVFLDWLTEQLEESNTETVYTDYKHVTPQELADLGLDHLIGTHFLRAAMSGYYMNVNLYNKAKSQINPNKLEDFKKRKIREIIDKDAATSRVQVQKAPKINKELALKYMNNLAAPSSTKDKDKLAIGKQMLEESRFKALFENPRFEIDNDAERYRMLKPVLSRMDDKDDKKKKRAAVAEDDRAVEEELEGKGSDESSSDEGNFDDNDESEQSSDEEPVWTKVKQEHKKVNQERKAKEREERTVMHEYQGDVLKLNNATKANRLPIGERLAAEDSTVRFLGSVGSREMTFSTAKKRDRTSEIRNKEHKNERRKIIRTGIKPKKKYTGVFQKRK